MPAPKGNKFGYANSNAGRPATWTKEIVDKEAELFIEWSKGDDALIFRKFAPLRGYPHEYLYRWKETNEAFSHAFKFAQSLIGTRREELGLEKCIQRDMPMYFEELNQFEREALAYKSKLAKDEKEAEINFTQMKEMSLALKQARDEIKELKSS